MKTKRQSKRAAKSISRRVLEKCVADLTERLGQQLEIANAIKTAARPVGSTLVGAAPMLTVLELSLDAHAQALRQIHVFAEMLASRI